MAGRLPKQLGDLLLQQRRHQAELHRVLSAVTGSPARKGRGFSGDACAPHPTA
jgi:hypothetical protein